MQHLTLANLSPTDFQTLKRKLSSRELIADEEVDLGIDEANVDAVINNLTFEAFSHLEALANGRKLDAKISSLETQYTSDTQATFFDRKSSNAYPLSSFKKETNFDDQDSLDRPIRTLEAISNLFSTVVKVLFGYEFFKPGQDRRTLEEKKKGLEKEIYFWKGLSNKHYDRPYSNKLKEAFEEARVLLDHQTKFLKEIKFQRITLLALGMLTLVGVLLSKRALTYLSFSAALINLVYMFTRYGLSSYMQTKLADDLKSSVTMLRLSREDHILKKKIND